MKTKQLLFASLFFLLTTIFIYAPILLSAKLLVTNGLIHSDLLNQNFPFRWRYALELKRGNLWLWTNLIGNGFPVFATGQAGQLYPINLILSLFLNPLAAFNLALFLHLAIAGLATVLYGRVLKLSLTAGLIAGLAYAFSGFFTIHLGHVAMIQVASLIPLNLLALELILKSSRQTMPVIGLAILWALQALAGHHELLFFLLIIEFLYLTIRTFQLANPRLSLARTWPQFLIAGGLALLLAAPQVLPTFELTQRSPRAKGVSFAEATGYQLPLNHLLTLVFPRAFRFSETVRYETATPDAINLWETYLYIGLIPLGLALLGLVSQKGRRRPLRTAWTIILVTSFLLALGRAAPLFTLLWKLLPPMRLFKSPTRFLLFFEFSLAMLAAYGWEVLARKILSPRLRSWLAIFLIATIIIDLKLNNARIHPTDDPQNWLNPPSSARLLQFKTGSRYHSLGTTQLDYRLIDDLNVQRQLRNLLPSNYGMIFNLPAASFQAGLFTSEHLQLLKGTLKDRLMWSEESLGFIPPDEWLQRMNRQSVEFILSPLPLYHQSLRLIGVYGFKKSLPGQLLFPDEQGYRPVTVHGTYLYQNEQVWPRVFLTGAPTFDQNPTKISRLLGQVKTTGSTENELELEVSNHLKANLIILDLNYPGWQAIVDGQKASLSEAAEYFRAVNLDPGNHQVRLVYQPASFRQGLGLLLLGVLLVIGLARLSLKRKS